MGQLSLRLFALESGDPLVKAWLLEAIEIRFEGDTLVKAWVLEAIEVRFEVLK